MLTCRTNSAFADLCSLGLCESNSIKQYYPRVRDRDDVSVYKCYRCGAMILSRSDQISESHYANQAGLAYWSADSRREAIVGGYEDLLRREADLRCVVANKHWMDVGTGAGGILDRVGSVATEVIAVEPQQQIRTELLDLGYAVYEDIALVPDQRVDVITMYHVFEHLVKPLSALKVLRKKLKANGRVIVEVPHAGDFLMSYLELSSFKDFTFWSEHLLLHTRLTLEAFLRAAGFERIVIKAIQRYPLANHLYWLSKGMPGGHLRWAELRTTDLDEAYANMLASLDLTDTLIAYAETA
jgi:2-polyprenyl-3-methyl-5-hydroxy-6-metoxy-1,4-benzoquinol methylase